MTTLLLFMSCSPHDLTPYRPAPRPLPTETSWGSWVSGQRLGLAAATRYDTEELVTVLLRSEPTNPDEAPYLRFSRGGHRELPQYRLELTGPAGRVTVVETAGGGSFGGGNTQRLILRPAVGAAGWPYFPPGRYHLSATLNSPRDRFDACGWVGRLEAEPVTFEVRAGPRRGYTPSAAVAVLGDLLSPDLAVRRSAVARADVGWQSLACPATVGGLFGPAEAFRGAYTIDAAFLQLHADADWKDAMRVAGLAAVTPLLAHAGPDRPSWVQHLATGLLALPGPDPRTLSHLDRLAASGVHDVQCLALHTLGRLGPDAVPILVRTARKPAFNTIVRRVAVEELATAGTADGIGPFLIEVFGGDWPGEVRQAAVLTADALDCRAVLPQLRLLATSDPPGVKYPDGAAQAALQTFARMADPADALPVVRVALGGRAEFTRRTAAKLLGAIGDRSDVARLVRLLDDSDWGVRWAADEGLRGLADKPEGVGFDAHDRREPKLWSDWFAAHPPR